ncbi:hypothetical protein CF328_g3952 [Tilletia controversa]|nr:hypothetical protein CF328_g3952 [Tilletia controversa]
MPKGSGKSKEEPTTSRSGSPLSDPPAITLEDVASTLASFMTKMDSRMDAVDFELATLATPAPPPIAAAAVVSDTSATVAPDVATKSPSDDARSVSSPAEQAAARLAAQHPASAPPVSRPLKCQRELIGSFDGEPTRLERFLSRVADMARSNSDPAWEPAVVVAIPQALEGIAARWHAGLPTTTVRGLRTVEDYARLMRRAFAVNRAQLRQDAHDRRWQESQESGMAYLFDKVQLLRYAFGDSYTESVLVQEVADKLPPSMYAYIRLPEEGAVLDDLQDAIIRWEPVWRKVHNIPLLDSSSMSSDKVVKTPSASTSAPVRQAPASAPPPRPPRAVNHTVPSASVTAPGPQTSLPATYDPARIVPAANGLPRMYRRPNSNKVLRLGWNCNRCGGEHFDFEHEYLLQAGQINTLTVADYPEIDEADLGLAPF